MIDKCTFYRSYYEAIKQLKSKDQLKIYQAIMEYQFDGKVPILDGFPKIVFDLIKPNIDANNIRKAKYSGYENTEKEDTNRKQIVEELQTNCQQNVSPRIKNYKLRIIKEEKNIKKEEPITTLVLKTGNEYPISEEDIKGWQMTYKGVDVKQELLLMREWCKANPQKRKTESGILRFITSWLAREQKQTQVKSKDTLPVYDDSKNREYNVNDDDILEMMQE